jgi:formate/nitrite transporter FocA (FNT family)
MGLLITVRATQTGGRCTGERPAITVAAYAKLTWVGFLVNNLIPVTIGNIIGGAGLVGLVYWFA